MANSGYRNGGGSPQDQRLNVVDTPAQAKKKMSKNPFPAIWTAIKWVVASALVLCLAASFYQSDYEGSQRGKARFDALWFLDGFKRFASNLGGFGERVFDFGSLLAVPALKNADLIEPGQIAKNVVVCTDMEHIKATVEGNRKELALGEDWLKTAEGKDWLKIKAWNEALNNKVNHEAAQLAFRGASFYTQFGIASDGLPYGAKFIAHKRPSGWNPPPTPDPELPLPREGFEGPMKVMQRDMDDPVVCPKFYSFGKPGIPGLKYKQP